MLFIMGDEKMRELFESEGIPGKLLLPVRSGRNPVGNETGGMLALECPLFAFDTKFVGGYKVTGPCPLIFVGPAG
jgi:hypothetical protein